MFSEWFEFYVLVIVSLTEKIKVSVLCCRLALFPSTASKFFLVT